jgi:tRNA-binding EMAP/Myf-like protein
MNNVARIVVVNSIKPHPNADKLQIVNLFGTQIITDKNVHVGDQMIYFDSNLRLSQSYLHHNNLYRNSDLNLDKTVSGYFDANGRVKAIKLRNEFSDGVLMPLRSLDYLPDTDKSKLIPGYEFQTYSQELICEKYIAQVTTPSVGNKNKIKKKRVQRSAMFVELWTLINTSSIRIEFLPIHCVILWKKLMVHLAELVTSLLKQQWKEIGLKECC